MCSKVIIDMYEAVIIKHSVLHNSYVVIKQVRRRKPCVYSCPEVLCFDGFGVPGSKLRSLVQFEQKVEKAFFQLGHSSACL